MSVPNGAPQQATDNPAEAKKLVEAAGLTGDIDYVYTHNAYTAEYTTSATVICGAPSSQQAYSRS